MFDYKEFAPYFFLALSIVLIVLGSILRNSTKPASGAPETSASKSATGVVVLGVIFFLGSAAVWGPELYGKFKPAASTYYYF